MSLSSQVLLMLMWIVSQTSELNIRMSVCASLWWYGFIGDRSPLCAAALGVWRGSPVESLSVRGVRCHLPWFWGIPKSDPRYAYGSSREVTTRSNSPKNATYMHMCMCLCAARGHVQVLRPRRRSR